MDADVAVQRSVLTPAANDILQTAPTSTPADAPRLVKRALGGFVDSDDEDDEDVSSAPAPTHATIASPSATQPETTGTVTQTQATAETPLPIDDDSQMHDAQIVPDNDDNATNNDENPEENEEDRYDLLFSAGPQALADPTRTISASATIVNTVFVKTCNGRAIPVRQRSTARAPIPYETMVAQRSKTKEGRAQRNFYGIAIHELVDGARAEIAAQAAAQAAAEPEKRKAADSEAQAEAKKAVPVLAPTRRTNPKSRKHMLWTEKYRARNFIDLVGDDLTNRLVLRWLKRWDPVVFPGARKRVPLAKNTGGNHAGGGPGGVGPNDADEKPHRKILILTGPPGLGKTTLAHVCARQAGYEVLEINASDDRSRDVVNGRIRTSLGTESVKAVEQLTSLSAQSAAATDRKPKVARPVCVVVDEVDGVVSGSGAGGEGGFVKALIDLVLLDQKNAAGGGGQASSSTSRRRKRGDDFRQMRPLILICNDIYHVSLRPLRLSGLAEIVHVGKPSVDTVVNRIRSIFEKEGIPCEKEAARKLCEAAWGMATGPEAAAAARRGTESTAEGDLRGVMVVGEWVARRIRAEFEKEDEELGKSGMAAPLPFLSRQWVEKNVLPDLASTGSGGDGGIGARGLGRGGVREIVTRIFQEGAGFPKTLGGPPASSLSKATSADTSYRHEQPKEQMSFAEHRQRYAMGRLREMIETSGDVDRIMTDIFGEYPNREFNDDSFLSKPDAAYEWMHFHDACARRVFGSQEWELAAYTSQPVLACHQLFATSRRHVPDNNADDGAQVPPVPFTGPRADFQAREAEKHNRAALQAIQAQLPPSLLRAFRNAEDVAADFLPYVVRLVSPDVKPVLVHVASAGKDGKQAGPTAVASVRREGEKVLVRRAAEVLAELGIKLQRGMLEDTLSNAGPPGRPQWVYRMEPDLDMLVSFETGGNLLLAGSAAPTRYSVRQVLDQELRKTLAARDSAARQARFSAGTALALPGDADKENVLADRNMDKTGRLKRKSGAADLELPEGAAPVKRDFFGRIITPSEPTTTNALQEVDGNARGGGVSSSDDKADAQRVWVTFHEGLNNAVRKPISVDEFLRGL
ncbi:Chromosome transmission fidelity protein 18 [Sporothrix eucalyptigena]|uniref:Chromosome transmission fidelity protein 18 n=1 Tax=Sporothrix eucalyptigena TaxID=1812306 RepID=A0ABP0B216_9PEZI